MRNLLHEEAAARAALLDVTSYDVDLDLTGDGSDFGSTTVVRFTCRQPGTASFAELDGELIDATLNGAPVSEEGNRITLPDLHADNELRVVARCAYSNTGEGLHRFVDPADGLVYVWGQSFLDDAQRQFACFDQPDLKAVLRLQVTAPEEWTVVANGRGTRDGDRWTFAETERMPPYLFTVAGGPWVGERRVHDGIELGVWCRQSLGPHLEAEELFEVTAQCFDSFHERFGIRYPFGDTYDQLWVPEFNHGGMENAGAVTFTEDLLFRSKVTDADRRQRAMVIAHEMAHMWFGNLVTMRWFDDLWLNESFAELMGFFTTDRATRFEGGWLDFCTGRKAWGYSADQKPTTHPISGEVADNRTALLNFDGISYAKGASVLRQLMAWLGEEVFFEGVRRYLTRHAFGNTSLADFLAALEEVSGRDLEQWTESWLRTPGVSTLRVEQGAVVQTAPAQYPVLRDHRIRIGRYALDDGVLVAAEPLEVEVSGARTPVDGLAAHDLVLLNDGDLTFAKIRFDDRSLGTVVDHLWKLPDPLARALCWSSLYDAARDAELPARVLVQAVLNNAEGETDTGVVENLLAQSRLAATAWTTDAALGRALAEKARHVLTRTEPGSGLQLVWAKGWVSITDDTAALRALLDAPPAGIAVDTELRWHLLRRLAVLGALDDADIVAEEERDRTAAGQRHACYARAARPDAASKAAAWERVLRDRSLSNHQTEAYSQGFWQHASVSVTAPWVERYFDEIRALWEEHGPEVARRVAHFLYPSTHVSPEVLARADAFLADDSLPPGLRRVVLEQQDELRRAVAARKLS